jgi:hypothetical protein
MIFEPSRTLILFLMAARRSLSR